MMHLAYVFGRMVLCLLIDKRFCLDINWGQYTNCEIPFIDTLFIECGRNRYHTEIPILNVVNFIRIHFQWFACMWMGASIHRIHIYSDKWMRVDTMLVMYLQHIIHRTSNHNSPVQFSLRASLRSRKTQKKKCASPSGRLDGYTWFWFYIFVQVTKR